MNEEPNIDWVKDISEMHTKFGVNKIVRTFDADKLKLFIEFRLKFLQEELTEAIDALANNNADDIVDAMIDLCVVAIGTLDALDVNAYVAWDRVHDANMTKSPGIKASRPNPMGLPDLIKSDGWQAPSHADNIGLMSKLLNGTVDSISS
jgi:predicted HAD superfamily Cof-like phosphohydrolase